MYCTCIWLCIVLDFQLTQIGFNFSVLMGYRVVYTIYILKIFPKYLGSIAYALLSSSEIGEYEYAFEQRWHGDV